MSEQEELTEMETLQALASQLAKENARLKASLTEAVKALEFYADDSSDDEDIHRGGYWIGHCDDYSDPMRRLYKDEGQKARIALAKLRGEGK